MIHCWYKESGEVYSLMVTIDEGIQHEMRIGSNWSREQIIDSLIQLAVDIEEE